jgi:hypothetical protein
MPDGVPDLNVAAAVPLSWTAVKGKLPFTNLGDALSPFVVAMLANKPVKKTPAPSDETRMAAAGTMGQTLIGGRIHLWGTGFDARVNPLDRGHGPYVLPPNTEFIPHAVRGRRTAALLRDQGVSVPEVFGDPVWFMPRFFPAGGTKTHELGVVLHLTELRNQVPGAGPRAEYARYQVPPSLRDDVVVIDTLADRSVDGLRRKVAAIAACRRIVSTSLHALVIAETYGIPCAWFGFFANARTAELDIENEINIDHRMADFYSGVGRSSINAYVWPRTETVDWDDVMRGVDRLWQPLDYGGRALFDAFPLKTDVDFDGAAWPVRPELLEGVRI